MSPASSASDAPLNVAVTVWSAFIVTLQLVPLDESQPLQLPKVEFPSGEAISVTAVPWARDALHVGPQLIPPPLTVPDPVPLLCTISVCMLPPSLPQAANISDATTTQLPI